MSKAYLVPSEMIDKYGDVYPFNQILKVSPKIVFPGSLQKKDQRPEISSVDISDGYHSFRDLYAHRNRLFIELCRMISMHHKHNMAWCSLYDSEGKKEEGWFLMGVFDNRDQKVMKDIAYHIPIAFWDEAASFCEVMEVAPEYDGYTAFDVLQRLKTISK